MNQEKDRVTATDIRNSHRDMIDPQGMPIIAVVFNGPPRCGKDTLGRLIAKYLSGPVCAQSFKAELFHCVMAQMESTFKPLVPLSWWGTDDYDKLKDDKDFQIVMADGFEGTAREVLIHVSEDIIKPQFGDDYFGTKVAQKLQPGYNLITDGGFNSEIKPILATADYVIVVQLTRDNYTFAGDSRDYLNPKDLPGAEFITLHVRDDEQPTATARRLGQRLTRWETDCSITSRRMSRMRRVLPSPVSETFFN